MRFDESLQKTLIVPNPLFHDSVSIIVNFVFEASLIVFVFFAFGMFTEHLALSHQFL